MDTNPIPLILYWDPEKVPPSDIQSIVDYINKTLPDHFLIALPTDTFLISQASRGQLEEARDKLLAGIAMKTARGEY